MFRGFRFFPWLRAAAHGAAGERDGDDEGGK
jgi:hypothetical protein